MYKYYNVYIIRSRIYDATVLCMNINNAIRKNKMQTSVKYILIL